MALKVGQNYLLNKQALSSSLGDKYKNKALKCVKIHAKVGTNDIGIFEVDGAIIPEKFNEIWLEALSPAKDKSRPTAHVNKKDECNCASLLNGHSAGCAFYRTKVRTIWD